MPETNTAATQEASVSLELPRNRHLVTLPPIESGISDFGVRLGMHTDSIHTLLRTLDGFPDLDQLKVEGRVLNNAQEEALEASQRYQFYMSSRVDRRDQLLVPESVGFTPERIAEATQSGFSPASLAQEIGYRVGYFNAKKLRDEWFAQGTPNIFLSRFGGANEFYIGSDTLTPQRLAGISMILHNAFVEQERSVAGLGGKLSPLPAISGFTSYSMNILKNSLTTNVIEKINLIGKKIDYKIEDYKIQDHFLNNNTIKSKPRNSY